jgi:hypothetical protein
MIAASGTAFLLQTLCAIAVGFTLLLCDVFLREIGSICGQPSHPQVDLSQTYAERSKSVFDMVSLLPGIVFSV